MCTATAIDLFARCVNVQMCRGAEVRQRSSEAEAEAEAAAEAGAGPQMGPRRWEQL